MMIDNQDLRRNGLLSAKVSLQKSMRQLEVGSSIEVDIDRLMYARQMASVINTTRGYKSIKVIPEPEHKVIKIIRID